jgi:uncharacterized protein YeeX (DUF496 family)
MDEGRAKKAFEINGLNFYEFTDQGFNISQQRFEAFQDLLATFNTFNVKKDDLDLFLTMTKDWANDATKKLSDQDSVIEALDNMLKDWAKAHGISVETIENLRERFKDRYEDGILGVADLAQALIGLAEDRNADTLAEEVGHFAVEILLNTPAMQRALDLVVNTDEYAQVKEDYKNIYTTEDQFKKEALGKILAQHIVSNYTAGQNQSAFKTYLNSIKSAFKRFVEAIFGKFGKEYQSQSPMNRSA